MKILRTITDKDIIPGYVSKTKINYISRLAVRAVVFDDNKKIALLHVSKRNYHKLPGGGIKPGENFEQALLREGLEEIGCSVIVKEIGMIREYRDKFKQVQDSYCYLAKVKGEKGEPKFTKKEIRQGFTPVWVAEEEKGTGPMWVVIDTAIEILKTDKPDTYEGQFIQARDLEFLKEAKKIL